MMRQVERSLTSPPVSRRLKIAQAEAQLTNDALARRVGVSTRLVQKWRAGHVVPTWKNVVSLGLVLDREPGWFYNDDGPEAAA